MTHRLSTPSDPSDYVVAPNLKQIVRPYFESTTTPAAAAWVADAPQPSGSR